MSKFKQIVEGWRNLLIPPKDMKVIIEEVAGERNAICSTCPFNSTNAKALGHVTYRPDEHCIKCGCTLAAATRSLSKACPLGYWEAYTTDEERYEIEKQIQDEDNKLQTQDPGSPEGAS